MRAHVRELASVLVTLLLASSCLQAQKVILSTRYNSADTCKIMYADSNGLVILRSDMPSSLEKSTQYAVRLSAGEVNRIVILRESHFFSCAGKGFLIGAGTGAIIGLLQGDDTPGTFMALTAGDKALIFGASLGVVGSIVGGIVGAAEGVDDEFVINGDSEKYYLILRALNEVAMYHPPAPSWLGDVTMQKDAPTVRTQPPAAKEVHEITEPSRKRIHMTLGVGLRVAGLASGDIKDAFNRSGFGGTYRGWFGPITYPVNNGTSFYWDLAGEYSVTGNLRLGLKWNSSPTENVDGNDWENESTHAESFMLLCTYVPHPVDPLLASHFEFSMTAGLSYNTLYVDDNISSISYSAYGQRPAVHHSKSTVPGIFGQVGIDYYISRYISFQCTLRGHLIPSAVSIPEVKYTNPHDGSTKSLVTHSVNFSGIDLTTGIRLHF